MQRFCKKCHSWAAGSNPFTKVLRVVFAGISPCYTSGHSRRSGQQPFIQGRHHITNIPKCTNLVLHLPLTLKDKTVSQDVENRSSNSTFGMDNIWTSAGIPLFTHTNGQILLARVILQIIMCWMLRWVPTAEIVAVPSCALGLEVCSVDPALWNSSERTS